MPDLSGESWVLMGLMGALWFVREIFAIVVKARNGNGPLSRWSNRPPAEGGSREVKIDPPTPAALAATAVQPVGASVSADGSGRFAALPPEEIATKRELNEVKGDFKDGLDKLGTKLDNHAKATNDSLMAIATSIGRLEGARDK